MKNFILVDGREFIMGRYARIIRFPEDMLKQLNQEVFQLGCDCQ